MTTLTLTFPFVFGGLSSAYVTAIFSIANITNFTYSNLSIQGNILTTEASRALTLAEQNAIIQAVLNNIIIFTPNATS